MRLNGQFLLNSSAKFPILFVYRALVFFYKVTVSNSRLIHVAVNFCLIAATVIQPMAIVAAQGACAQGQCCQAQTVCQVCKRCEVNADGDLCGCCSGNKGDAGACCSRKAERPKHDEWFGEISDLVPEPPRTDDQEWVQDQVALTSCMCGIRSEPIAPAPQRIPVKQVRNLVFIAYSDRVESNASLSVCPDGLTSRLPHGNQLPHFSQRILCVWRI